VGDVELGALRGRLHLFEEVVDLALADLDLAVDLALLQARDHDLAADVLAELVERHALPFERAPKVGERHAVLLRDHAHRSVELQVVDAHAGLDGKLHLDAVDDHALEHLPLEHFRRRQGRVLALQLRGHQRDALLQIALRDHVLVDDRHDPVDQHRSARGRAARRRRGGRLCGLGPRPLRDGPGAGRAAGRAGHAELRGARRRGNRKYEQEQGTFHQS
jgi:hypothetical protein